MQSTSPQNPTVVVAQFPDHSAVDVAAAFARSRPAQRQWAAAPALERSQALDACADLVRQASHELIDLGVVEVGKPRTEMAAEVTRAVGILRYYAAAALDPNGETYPGADPTCLEWSRDVPWGAVGLITPWNFPIAIPLWKAAPALAYGNAVVCKPAPAGTAVALRLAELMQAVLPADVFTVVTGGGPAGEAVVAQADAISFTGSVAVGQRVVLAGAARGEPVQAEMGGQNPSIVLADADPQAAAQVIAAAAMAYAGQKCTATSRVVVVGDPRPFTEALVAAVEDLLVGDPDDPAVVVGPVISQPAQATVVAAAQEAISAGGEVLLGGHALGEVGHYVAPTLVRGLAPEDRLAQEETFGPFVVIQDAKDLATAVGIANGVRYGLAAAIFTGDLGLALRLSSEVEAGMIRVNGPTTGVDFYAPFGGLKESSYGLREQGKAARRFYTQRQTITMCRPPG